MIEFAGDEHLFELGKKYWFSGFGWKSSKLLRIHTAYDLKQDYIILKFANEKEITYTGVSFRTSN